jgi:zinc protease
MNTIWNAFHRTLHVAVATTACWLCAGQAHSAPATAPSESIAPATTQPSSNQLDETTDNSPLPQDPAYVRGQFANGLHYLILKNANPPGKVFLQLAVRTGSLNETDQQSGLAHFLEHMAFKGSTHYEPTRLIPLLTHLGMRFGADTNAHTGQYETVYMLAMPDTQPKTIDLALTIFSDFANGLSLFPIQIESERRVIKEETLMRMNLSRRMQTKEFEELFPGSQFAVHTVVGDPEVVKTAQQPLLADYWNKWYRPEKMTLVVVGDVDPDAIIAQAKPILGTFTARTPTPTPIDAGLKPFDAPRAVVITDPEQLGCDVELMNVHPPRPIMTTIAQFRQKLIENIAQAIVNHRMAAVAKSGRAPFHSAKVNSGEVGQDAHMVTARAQCDPKDWETTLSLVTYEINRTINLGFSQRELDIVRDSILTGPNQAVNTDSTQDSSALVTSITQAVDTDQAMLSKEQEHDLLTKLLPGVTVDDLRQAFNADFGAGNYAYVLKLPVPAEGHTLPSESDVLAVADKAWHLPTVATTQVATAQAPTTQAATTQIAVVTLLLPAEPTPGRVHSCQEDSDLGVTTVVFENGVVMHHKFSDYKKGQVQVQVVLPGGTLEETSENHGISEVASLMIQRPATSRLSSSQIRSLLGEKSLSIKGGLGFDELSIGITGSPSDLPTGLRVVNAVLTDGKLEQSVVSEWKRNALQTLARKPMNPDAQIPDALASTVRGSDARFAPMTAQTIGRQQRDSAQAWFKHIADHAAMEVSVVGDLSADDAVSMVGKYLGSLPQRTGKFSDLDSLRHLEHAPGPYSQIVRYTADEPKALVMAGFVGCDESDPQRRPLALAALTLSDRMMQHARVEQQIVYTIDCTVQSVHGLPGAGTISAISTTDPGNADRLADLIIGTIKDFAVNGPSNDELATAKSQLANQLTPQMKDPHFWLGELCDLEYRHRSLDDIKQLPDVYNTFSASQVRDAVRKYATDSRLVRIEVLPAEQPPSPTTAPATRPVADSQQLLH